MSRFLRVSLLFLSSLLGMRCASTPSPPAAKAFDFCLCGSAFTEQGELSCAIWGEANQNSGKTGQKTWKNVASPSCGPQECGKFFTPYCQKIQMANLTAKAAPAPSTAPCYCDAVLMENDRGQTQLLCAAWLESSPELLEYHTLEDCSANRCAQAPFVLAPKVCAGGFRSFYLPSQNRKG